MLGFCKSGLFSFQTEVSKARLGFVREGTARTVFFLLLMNTDVFIVFLGAD